MLPMKATLEWIGLYCTSKFGEITLYGSLWCSTYQYNPVTLEALRDHQENTIFSVLAFELCG